MILRSASFVPAATLLLIAVPAHAARWQAIERIPGYAALSVLVQKKARVYFRITPESPLVFTVEGPGRLRLVSRAEVPRGVSRPISYKLRVDEGGKILEEQLTESSAANKVKLADGVFAICKSRNLAVDVPAGNHRLTVSVTGARVVLIRPLFSGPTRDEVRMISITPVEATRSVTLSEGERLIPYYSTFLGKPVKFRIVGPTSLELSTRLDFDATMRGSQGYRIAVTEGGERIREGQFKTTKATTATYTDLNDRSASKLDRIVIPVSDGVHDISVELLSPQNGSAEIHARIPQPTVGSQE